MLNQLLRCDAFDLGKRRLGTFAIAAFVGKLREISNPSSNFYFQIHHTSIGFNISVLKEEAIFQVKNQ